MWPCNSVDGLSRHESLYTCASQGHVLSAGYGIVLLAIIGMHLLLAAQGVSVAIGHVGISTPVIIGACVVAVRTVFQHERRQLAAFVAEVAERHSDITMPQALMSYAVAALVVMATGTRLPFVGEALATIMGWLQTFVHTLFVAAATSTPEVVVTMAAVRLGGWTWPSATCSTSRSSPSTTSASCQALRSRTSPRSIRSRRCRP